MKNKNRKVRFWFASLKEKPKEELVNVNWLVVQETLASLPLSYLLRWELIFSFLRMFA